MLKMANCEKFLNNMKKTILPTLKYHLNKVKKQFNII
jgi:hypothetical protein